MNMTHETEKTFDFMAPNRRGLLSMGLAALAVSGCASLPGLSFTDAIRRLMTLSSQRAFAQLIEPGGFYDDQLTRIALPEQLGGGRSTSIVSALLSSGAFRTQLQQQMNRAAEKGAERAAPFVADSIRAVGIDGAREIISGGPSAATAFLRGNIGDNLLGIMAPGVADGLALFDNDIISRAVNSVAGFDVGQLGRDITTKAGNSIWAAMGREEAAIRANPRATNDPLLIGVFGLAGA